MTIPLEVRRRITSEIPWITRLVKARQCDGKAGRCKVRAFWRFRALKRSWAKDGVYCWFHIFHAGLYYDMEEEKRTEKWLNHHYPNGIK